MLMSTYNGESFLEDQIKSILNQKLVNVDLLIRDDGSTDSTRKILAIYEKSFENIKVVYGENIGVKHSFLELVKLADEDKMYAFSDQDDIWLPNKLHRAITFFQKQSKPQLYMSKTTLVNHNLEYIGKDTYLSRPQKLEELVVKNNGIGCTMVFNANLRNKILLVDRRKLSKSLLLHDYWIYLICVIFDGLIYYDTQSFILYRQHENNVIGNTDNLITKIKNNGIFNYNCIRSNNIKELYVNYYNYIENDEIKLFLDDIVNYQKNYSAKKRLLSIKGIRTASFLENINLKILLMLNKF